ncbi:MAG TPA: hypothetical protein PKG54_01250 [Phycisphaerae bacterium]|jgi:hypothetical protein|nr:hypothetical protein [Phycisphaerae bacterium]HOB73127.1 hypothetical protein [Phycisphaerae bacterium]HOJ53993.1 hypothetical protein [Phycisphaerae bacterium]HOL26404.1 hypothetical protein [Phycisphaerae bacterium]HPP20383.1 hypothetical protein [Phycisphaerae bacterium]
MKYARGLMPCRRQGLVMPLKVAVGLTTAQGAMNRAQDEQPLDQAQNDAGQVGAVASASKHLQRT